MPSSELELRISDVAARQHGLLTRAQLLEIGLGRHAIGYRLRGGRLRRLHAGVYQVGPLSSGCAREMAAVLAAGPCAVLSHRSAGSLWRITRGQRQGAPVEVLVVGRRGGRRPGIRAFRTREIPSGEVTQLDGIRITTPARTLLDLASVLRGRELERAVAEAFARSLSSREEMVALVRGSPRRRGLGALRSLLAVDADPPRTRSEAEERFLALLRRGEVPRPEVNVRVGGMEVDFFWRAERLVVEVDGRAYHATAGAFDSDRRRDAVLVALGIRVMRVTWLQITREPEALLVRLALALAVGSGVHGGVGLVQGQSLDTSPRGGGESEGA